MIGTGHAYRSTTHTTNIIPKRDGKKKTSEYTGEIPHT
jgi:hypothetical protein